MRPRNPAGFEPAASGSANRRRRGGVAARGEGADAAPINWKLPSAYPVNNFLSENLAAFAKDLAEATGGKLAIKAYPNASLFPATAIKSAVRIGQARSTRVNFLV
jgi:TRAP-type C4-dicarboxylate transport system substrate-binding protein